MTASDNEFPRLGICRKETYMVIILELSQGGVGKPSRNFRCLHKRLMIIMNLARGSFYFVSEKNHKVFRHGW